VHNYTRWLILTTLYFVTRFSYLLTAICIRDNAYIASKIVAKMYQLFRFPGKYIVKHYRPKLRFVCTRSNKHIKSAVYEHLIPTPLSVPSHFRHHWYRIFSERSICMIVARNVATILHRATILTRYTHVKVVLHSMSPTTQKTALCHKPLLSANRRSVTSSDSLSLPLPPLITLHRGGGIYSLGWI
jgi:hypothetical protein